MCVMSMVYDRYIDKWNERLPQIPPLQWPPNPTPPPLITREEVQELLDWVRRARIYDEKMNQPNCELEEKKKKLKELATLLGVQISFEGE